MMSLRAMAESRYGGYVGSVFVAPAWSRSACALRAVGNARTGRRHRAVARDELGDGRLREADLVLARERIRHVLHSSGQHELARPWTDGTRTTHVCGQGAFGRSGTTDASIALALLCERGRAGCGSCGRRRSG
jgi:hypothetical protein